MRLTFRFGRPATRLQTDAGNAVLELPHAVLEGNGEEHWSLDAGTYSGELAAGVHWWRGPSQALAVVHRPVDQSSMVDTTREIYAELLRGSGPLDPCRIWNFIPDINQQAGELDSYKLFCVGRGAALAPWSAGQDTTRLPAASAVGTPDGHLCVVMLCTGMAVTPVENPQQIPAYRYPRRYGPQPPSFARASLVDTHPAQLLVSGTASIRQSESMHAGDPAAQLALACDNIDLVLQTAWHDAAAHGFRALARSVRMYLRNPDDWTTVRDQALSRLMPRLMPTGETLNVIQADICRPELLLEVEASLALPAT